MADTQRTIATMLTQLADNTTGAITEQVARDILMTLRNGHGSISMTGLPNATATTISNTTDYVAVAGTTALRSGAYGFDMPADGRLRYTGPTMRHFHVAVSLSYQAALNNQDVIFQVTHYDSSAVTAIPLTDSRIADRLAGTYSQSTALHADVMMDTNDYLYLEVRNTTAAQNVIVEYMYFFALSMP